MFAAVGRFDQVVNVSGDAVSAIDTESPSISATYSSTDVSNLPVNTRASAGGTSAYNILGTLAGVQTDASAGPGSTGTPVFSLQGGLPFQSETAVDGITVRNATGGNSRHRRRLPFQRIDLGDSQPTAC